MTTSIRMPVELKRRVDVYCATFGNIQLSTFIVDAIEDYLADQAKQGRRLPKLPPMEGRG